MTGHAPILVVDNHDSFVHTLVGYLHELGADTDLIEADAIATDAAASVVSKYRGVLISPGPGTPSAAGASIAVVRAAETADIPLLGVCLGHQAIAEAFGARVSHAPELMHGMTSLVEHDRKCALRRAAEPVHGHPLSLARDRARHPPCGARRHEPHRGRRDHGDRTSIGADPRGAVPSRGRADRGGSPAAGQLARDGRIRGCRPPRLRAPPAPPGDSLISDRRDQRSTWVTDPSSK